MTEETDDLEIPDLEEVAQHYEKQRKIFQEYIERVIEEYDDIDPEERIFVHFDLDSGEEEMTINNEFPYYPTNHVMEYEAEVEEDTGIVSLVRGRTVQTSNPDEDFYGEWMEL